MPESGNELPFKITKRAFTDLIKKDSKKPNRPVFAIPITVQDKLKLALPDKYGSLFSDENIPHSSSSSAEPTSGPSQQGPIVKYDQPPTSGPSQKGPVVKSSPTRVLRSSKSPTKPSPPPRKRRFLQKISDSDSEEETMKSPPSEDLHQALIPFSDQPESAYPVLVEPISAMPIEEPGTTVDIQMSETLPEYQAQSDVPLEQITAEVLQMNQESLIQVQETVAAPVQEISYVANSDAATKALASQTLSIFLNDDDDDDTEVTSVPAKVSASLTTPISDPVRESNPVRDASPVHDLSPVRESSPIMTLSTAPDLPVQHIVPPKSKVCQLAYFQGMCTAQPPSMEDGLFSIKATQRSMQSTLAALSSCVAQLVKFLTSADVKKEEKILKDKCSSDQPMEKKKPDGDEDGNEIADKNSGKQW
ncbi:uncharacterized protein LOC108204109 [Daucus carota subsp. sativus]|uniref:uncharacterized protein LOC108204109 n=1 Tax=Daucus carota subsp. sativus TaxID=79200 RepID=UPI00308287DA